MPDKLGRPRVLLGRLGARNALLSLLVRIVPGIDVGPRDVFMVVRVGEERARRLRRRASGVVVVLIRGGGRLFLLFLLVGVRVLLFWCQSRRRSLGPSA